MYGVGLGYACIVLAGGHAGVPLGLAVPYIWVNLIVETGRLDGHQWALAALSILAGIAVISWFASVVVEPSDPRVRTLQASVTATLAVSAVIANWMSEAPLMTVISTVPFAGAIVGFVHATRRRDYEAEDADVYDDASPQRRSARF
jgi:hypothetical protein